MYALLSNILLPQRPPPRTGGGDAQPEGGTSSFAPLNVFWGGPDEERGWWFLTVGMGVGLEESDYAMAELPDGGVILARTPLLKPRGRRVS